VLALTAMCLRVSILQKDECGGKTCIKCSKAEPALNGLSRRAALLFDSSAPFVFDCRKTITAEGQEDIIKHYKSVFKLSESELSNSQLTSFEICEVCVNNPFTLP